MSLTRHLIKREKGSPFGSRKIPPAILEQMLVKLACYNSDKAVHEWLASEGVKISIYTVKYYREHPDYQHIMEDAREKFESEIIKLELASKRRRIEELSEIYWILKGKQEWSGCRDTLKQIQSERELRLRGDGDIYQFNQFNSFPDDALRKRLEVNTKLIEEIKINKEANDACEIGSSTPSNGDGLAQS